MNNANSTNEVWNFHGYIALPLETTGRSIMGSTFFSADDIECGAFAEAMLSILSIRYGSLKELGDFVERCKDWYDMPAREIPEETVKELFQEFQRLLKLKER